MAKRVFEKTEADEMAIAYVPRKFPREIGASAKTFHALQSDGAGEAAAFRIDRIVAERTGVAELERLSMEEKVERVALERLKSVQEQAYKEAYDLGMIEGRERAHAETMAEIAARLDRFDALGDAIARQQSALALANEARLVRLAFAIATKLAMQEVRERPELVAGILRAAIEEAQADERIVARVSAEDRREAEAAREALGRDADSGARVKIEEDPSIHPGGCVIETNFGSVDATVEQRVKRLWEALSEKFPRSEAGKTGGGA